MSSRTNIPEVIMSLSDERFAYGPFVPHWVPKQYIQNYFASHHTDRFLVLNTTVEDVTHHQDRWKLTLRRHDPVQKADIWWEEQFSAVIVANGHYSIPYVLAPSPPHLRTDTHIAYRSPTPQDSTTIWPPSQPASTTPNSTALQPTTPTNAS